MHGCEHDGDVSWEQARRRARELGESLPAPVRDLPLERAAGGVLARDVHALVGLPAFDASAMDGYALAGPGPWRLVGRHLAGGVGPCQALAPGEAVEIATGARVPKGTESVLPYERARVEHDPVSGGGRVAGEVEHGRHVRWSGEETAPGETVLTRGHRVGPASLGIAASLGHETLPMRTPTVTIVVTGDEIARSGLPGDGRVRDAIGPILPGVASWTGAHVEPLHHLGDDRTELAEAMTGGGADVVVVCGSSSKGPADHVRSILAEAGADTVVDGVRCRPGHPQLLARSGNQVVVGLPGNPGAAMVAALTLFAPLVSALAGRDDPARVEGRFTVDGDVASHARDARLVAVRVEEGRAVPVGHDRPGSLRGAALADAYAVIPPGWRPGRPDSGVEIVRLP